MLDPFVDAEARLRDNCRKLFLSFLFFWSGGQLLVAERHNNQFDFFYETVAKRAMFYC